MLYFTKGSEIHFEIILALFCKKKVVTFLTEKVSSFWIEKDDSFLV
jgi:hypothetical protein